MAFDMSEVMATSAPRELIKPTLSQSPLAKPIKKEGAPCSENVPDNYDFCDSAQKALLDQALATFSFTEESIYIGSARSTTREEYMPCQCKLKRDEKGNKACCGEYSECINRLLQVECLRGVCPGGKHCKNQRFQRKQNSPVNLIHDVNKGYGLQAAEDYDKGQFVMEYVGEVISHNSFIRRSERYNEKGSKHFYFMSLKSDKYIDATTVGSLARFINHSCNPNCILQKWIVGSNLSIGIFTQRAIKAGEELTFDYQFQRFGADAQKCYCGEANCKGVLGSRKQTGSRDSEDPDDLLLSTNFNLGIADNEECSRLVQTMLQLAQDTDKALKILNKLNHTEESRLLKQFINLHGIVTLKTWLVDYAAEPEVCSEILSVMERLPFAYKNKLIDAGVCETLNEYASKTPDSADRVKLLISRWEGLPKKYIIPRLAPALRTESNSPDTSNKQDSAKEEGGLSSDSPNCSSKPVSNNFKSNQPRNGHCSPSTLARRGNSEFARKDGSAPFQRSHQRRSTSSNYSKGPRSDNFNQHPLGNGFPKPSNGFSNGRLSGDAGPRATNGFDTNKADGFSKSRRDDSFSTRPHNGYNNRHTNEDNLLHAPFSNMFTEGYGGPTSEGFIASHNSFDNFSSLEFHPSNDYPPPESTNWTTPPYFDQSATASYTLDYPEYEQSNSSGLFQPAVVPAPPEEALPPNWNTAIAPSGRVYYYHTLTNESTWDLPVAPPELSPPQTSAPPPSDPPKPLPAVSKLKADKPSSFEPLSKRPRLKSKKVILDTIYTYPELVARCRKMVTPHSFPV
ncbi:hypothetical protein DSO57_1034882 [Entomophthora muscae]|uniref:Uncharacterized protein n=1 Tax=Entomophthora muscae TaxID=34485 RepID=A0ACC2RQK6_9FUNG|nr:hypothetical protein DSO57_1034882 [Entomophthora muscae]